MNIAVLIDRITTGGVEKTAIREALELRRLGEEATLLVLNSGLSEEAVYKELLTDVKIIYLDRRLPWILRSTARVPGFAFFSLYHLYYPFLLPFVVKNNEWDYGSNLN